MADISQVKLPDGTTYNLKDSYVRTNYRALNNNDFDTINVTELNAGDLIVTGAARFLNTVNGNISGNSATATSATSATKATQDSDGNAINTTYLKKSGGTMTGTLNAQANVYTDAANTGSLNMGNSNIYGVNAIYTADAAESAGEGINFYRDATHVDTLWVAGGDILFVPNRAYGTSTTAANSQKVGRFTANPTSGQVVITDGTTGGMKSSGYTIATSVPSGAKFTDTTYSAGDNMTLSSNTFYATKRWNAVTQGQKWSRIILVANTVGVEGNSGLLHVACTRGNTVCNSTFLINTSHSSYGQITELGANNYSKFKVRLVVNSNGDYYVEIYDTASSIASGTTQTWHCSFLSFQPATITAYTTFTDGTTIPSGYTVKGEMETVVGSSALAIRNITRSGTTFTATRQDGTTFTFTQQDNDHYAWSDITSKPTTISGYGITDAKIVSGVITLGSNTITPLTASSTLNAAKLSGTIPTGCYTDTKNTAGSTDTSSKIFLIGATSQAANPQTYSQDTAYVGTDGCLYSGGTKVLTAHQDISGKVSKTGDTMSGALNLANATKNSIGDDVAIGDFNIAGTLGIQGLNGATGIGLIKQGETWGTGANYAKISYDGTSISVSKPFTDISATISVNANTGNSGTAGGLSLYGSAPTSYGIAMRTTANGGKHGAVQSDWAIYNYMINSGTNRGWIWKNAASGGGNVASIDCVGNAVFNGYVGIGGNTTNTSGVRQVYNSTTKSLDFVFVA